MMIAVLLTGGLLLLYFGADWLVKGSVNLAMRAGVPSLVVGLTIVAFGTSAPELVVSVGAGFKGLGDIAVGNVIGSNIFNIAIILGLSALVRPMKVNGQVLRTDTIIMIVVSIVLWLLLWDRAITRIEGICLTVGFVVYTFLTIYFGMKNADVQSNNAPANELPTERKEKKSIVFSGMFVVLGLAALVLGSKMFVKAAIDCAHFLKISEAVIGLTIVAAGTSLPELATSIVAAAKKEQDIAIGNIVGSNIFNILAILGISGTLTPLRASGIKMVDLAFMMGTALILFVLMRTGFKIVRLEGAGLLAIYGGYLWYLWPK